MPEVRVLGGNLRNLLGGKQLQVEADRVGTLLDCLVASGGEAVARLLFDGDCEPSIDLRVLVNGRSMVFLEGLDTKLATDDAVTIHLAGVRGFPGG
jgi:molybdopterin converting factor small subunit